MSAATGGGMGIKTNVVRKLKESRDKHALNAVNLMVDRDEARAALQELQARNAELEALAPRWALEASGATHWDGCWKEHRTCALERMDELERRVLIAEKKFELCNESRNRLTRFASSSEFWDVEAIGALIAEGKIQPTEQGGNN